MAETCPFCTLSDARVIWRSEQTLALYDQYPVSPGHVLLITKRHVPTYFDATPEEQSALWNSLEPIKQLLEQKHQPRGYHVGFNAGLAAGQTVMHLHVHFIPKYSEENPISLQDIIELAPQKPGREANPDDTVRALKRFFEAKPKTETEALTPELLDTWTSELCLSDADGKGLFLWLSPLRGLPSFVKRVTLSASLRNDPLPLSTLERGLGGEVLLAQNIRANACQLTVVPSLEPYTFTADIEDEPELQAALSRLNIPGLSGPTLFSIDASGVGHRMTGSTLTPNQRYRVLLPPGSEAHSDSWLLEGGWRVFEFTALQASVETNQFLQQNQLTLGSSPVSMQWVGSPARYDENERGERFACFASGQSVFVQITAPEKIEAFSLLAGPTGTLQKPLEANDRWNIALELDEPGRYALEVVPVETRFARARLFFTIEEHPPKSLSAKATATIDGEEHTLSESISLECDLSSMNETSLSLKTPPFWPVSIHWSGHQPRSFGRLIADEDGCVNLSWVLKETEKARSEEREAELRFDLGELGSLILQAEKTFSVEGFFSRVEQLWRERQGLLSASVPPTILLQQWIEPVCRLLGYSLQPIAAGHITALLWQTQRGSQGISKKKSRVLMLVSPQEDPKEVTNELKILCQEHNLNQAIITDGLRWIPFEVGLPIMVTIEAGKLFEPGNEMLRGMMLQSFLAR